MHTELQNKFYRLNDRRNKKGTANTEPFLSEWFQASLSRAIESKDITESVEQQTSGIIRMLADYKTTNNISTAVIGISGGIDSAVTAALFKEAGWTVKGVLMPIKQNPIETHLGLELVKQLDIDYFVHDLTSLYNSVYEGFRTSIDTNIISHEKDALVRAGNIRARLRMITLYNIAAQYRGLVGSTDNFSELSSGFWTLHGDVGDLAPIQSMTKSWEVPMMAEYLNVPAGIIEATPTDGLGIAAGDEAQFGFTYAHLDLVLLDIIDNRINDHISSATKNDLEIIESVKRRVASTAFKRANPTNLPHPICFDWRYQQLAQLDNTLVSHKQTITPEVKNV